MSIIYPHTKFHMPRSNGPLVIAVKLKAKSRFFAHPQFCYFTFYKNYLQQIYILLEDLSGPRC
jgi:hypothetical protein